MNISVYDRQEDLLSALHHPDKAMRIDVALVDAVHSSHLNLEEAGSDIRVTRELHSPSVHGVYVHGVDSSIVKCLHQQADHFRHESSEKLKDSSKEKGVRRKQASSLDCILLVYKYRPCYLCYLTSRGDIN